MRVLFLDIDGVLNSARTVVAFGGHPRGLEPEYLAMFDQVAINMLRGLCARADVQIVLSSAWRVTHDHAAVGQALGLPIFDRTPSLPLCRGGEIQAWLDSHQATVTAYAIVDDDPDMLPEQLPFFVQTDANEGLSWAAFSKLCSLFGLNVYDCAPRRLGILASGQRRLVWED